MQECCIEYNPTEIYKTEIKGGGEGGISQDFTTYVILNYDLGFDVIDRVGAHWLYPGSRGMLPLAAWNTATVSLQALNNRCWKHWIVC